MEGHIKEEIEEMPNYAEEMDVPAHFLIDEDNSYIYSPDRDPLDFDTVTVDNIKEEVIKDELLDEKCDINSEEILSDISIVPINFVACGIKQEFNDEEQISMDDYECNIVENVESYCKCEECGELCPDKKSLKNHMKFHKRFKNYKCTECSIVFSKLKELTAHLRLHKGLKSFKCVQCKEVFTPTSDLDKKFSDRVYKHMLTHTPAKPLKSSEHLCEFATSTYVKVENIPKVIVKNRFKCKDCNRKFSNPRVLADHMQQVHKKVKPFTCSECNLTLKPSNDIGKNVPISVFNDLVYDHMRTHTTNKRFKCSICGLKFSQPKEVKEHKLQSHGVGTYNYILNSSS